MLTSRGGMNHSMLPDDSSNGEVLIFENSDLRCVRLGDLSSGSPASADSARLPVAPLRCPSATPMMILPFEST